MNRRDFLYSAVLGVVLFFVFVLAVSFIDQRQPPQLPSAQEISEEPGGK